MSDHTEAILQETAHRPLPMPSGPWVMYQSWQQLLFMHWPLPWDALRALVPPELELERFDGSAWLGMTPFKVRDLRARALPAVPHLSEFAELNLRTYVSAGGMSGVFFFSLDAASTLAVVAARTGYALPYHAADMSLDEEDGWIRFRSSRHSTPAELDVRYRPTGDVFHATSGSLDHFLTERYALFTVRGGETLRADIHHRPWPLQTAEAVIGRNTVPQAHGIELPERAPVLHFAARQDTLIWLPTRMG